MWFLISYFKWTLGVFDYSRMNGCFWGKNRLTKTPVAAKVANFFEMISIFEFMRDEGKNFRKMVSGARARQKKYCQFNRQIFWHRIQGCVDFFFKLNMLPPYLLRLQGINAKTKWSIIKMCLVPTKNRNSRQPVSKKVKFAFALKKCCLSQSFLFWYCVWYFFFCITFQWYIFIYIDGSRGVDS